MLSRSVVLIYLLQTLCSLPWTKSSQDGRSEFRVLPEKYGYQTTDYNVTTQDGYILGLFRIRKTAEPSTPVLLMHGIMDTGDTWLLRGNGSLGMTLAERGRDVWLPSCRGGRYSRFHANATQVQRYWDFSFHELGIFDLAATIDKILEETGAEKIDAIAHSQGTTIFYVLLSSKPEYNNKVNLLIGLAPVAFLSNVPPPLSILIKYAPMINDLLEKIGVEEMFGESSCLEIIKAICQAKLGYSICASKYIFPISGFDPEELEPDFLEVLIDHFPSSTTRKTLNHFSQVSLRDEFAHYDYGEDGNLERYDQVTPPAYDLNAISAKMALLVGANDKLATVEDAQLLRQRLRTVVQFEVLPRALTNHLDFVWGRNMDKYLFPLIFELLDRHQYEDRRQRVTSQSARNRYNKKLSSRRMFPLYRYLPRAHGRCNGFRTRNIPLA